MRKLISLLVLLLLFSCKDYIDKPKNLIEKPTMSQILADLAINNQMSILNNKGSVENGTRFILEKYKIKGEDFDKSYKYYTVTKEIIAVLKDAQDLVLEKHPEAEAYLEETIKKKEAGFKGEIKLLDDDRQKREQRPIK